MKSIEKRKFFKEYQNTQKEVQEVVNNLVLPILKKPENGLLTEENIIHVNLMFTYLQFDLPKLEMMMELGAILGGGDPMKVRRLCFLDDEESLEENPGKEVK